MPKLKAATIGFTNNYANQPPDQDMVGFFVPTKKSKKASANLTDALADSPLITQ